MKGVLKMNMNYVFTDEDGKCQTVELRMICAESGTRRYGVEASLIHNESVVETETAEERFITEKEAEETMKMLCDFQVTPCTLCDVI